MTEEPTGSETIITEPEPVPELQPPSDPVEKFRKEKTKREARRKEVKIITTHIPPEPPVEAPAASPLPAPATDVESIAGRVAEILFSRFSEKQESEGEEEEEEVKPKPKTKAKTPRKVKETPAPAPVAPITKSFGWC